MKKFSLFLTLTMLCGMFQTGYIANAAANSTSIDDNFESYTVGSVFEPKYIDKWGTNGEDLISRIAEDATHGKYVTANNTSDGERHFIYRTSTPIALKTDDAHIVRYEMDIKPANGTIVFLTQGDTQSNVSNVYGAMFSGGNVYIGAWGNGSDLGAGIYTEGNWYHIVSTYDLARCELHTYIAELSDNGTATGNTIAYGKTITGTPTQKSGAYGIAYSVATGTEIAVDNVKMSNTNKWERTLVDVNFGDAGKKAEANNTELLISKWGNVSAAEDYIIQYDIDMTPTDFAAIKPSNGSKTFYGMLFNFVNESLGTRVAVNGWGPWQDSYTQNTRYRVHMEYDTKTGWNYVELTDNSGKTNYYYLKGTNLNYDAGVEIWGNKDTTVYSVKISTTSRKLGTAYEEDFDAYEADCTYADGYKIINKGGNHGKVLYKQDNGNKSLALFNAGYSARALGESKKVKYELDILPEDRAFVYMNTDMSNAIYLAEFSDNRLYLGAWGNGAQAGAGIYEPQRWYHIEAIADFNTNTFDTKVTSDKGVEYELVGKEFKGTICKGLSFDGEKYYIDNVKISNASADDFVNKTELKYADSFDDYADTNAFNQQSPNSTSLDENQVKINGWKINGTDAANASSFVERGDSGKYFNLGINANGATVNNNIEHKFNTTVSGGKFSYSYDIKPSAEVGTATIRIAGTNADRKTDAMGQELTSICPIAFTKGVNADGTPEYQILTMGETAIMDKNAESYKKCYIGEYRPEQWYHCNVTVDVANGTYSYSIEGEDENLYGGNTFHNIPGERPETDYTGITFMCWSDASTSVGFDNFEIAYDTAAPALERISYISNGQTYENPVSGADTMILNFNTALSGTSFRNGVVKLNDENKNAIAFNGDVRGDKYIMTLASPIQSGATYTITVSDAVASANLEKMAEAVSVNIVGEKGASVYKLKSVESDGGATWQEIKDYELEFQLTATVMLNNTDDKEKSMYLIDARYDTDGNLNYLKLYPITAGANTTKDETVTLEEHTGNKYASYKFMLWDGLENMIPISESITH